MLTKKFLKRIDSYIVRHFKKLKKFNDRRKELILKGCLYIDYVPEEHLEEQLRWLKQNFPQYLINFIAQRGLNEVDVYKKAHLDRRLFSKLRNVKDYMPRKRTVLMIAFAMQLDLHDMRELLHIAGYSPKRAAGSPRIYAWGGRRLSSFPFEFLIQPSAMDGR